MEKKTKTPGNVAAFSVLVAGIFFVMLAFACAANARDIGVAEDPSDIGMGARPIGMGRAFVAVADDENAIFVNPAGLSFIKRPCLTSMYTSLMSDVNYFVIGLSYPFPLFKNGGVGLGYIQSGIPGIITTSQSGFSMTDYYSNLLFLGASFMPNPDLSFGGSLKLFSQGFSGTENYAGTGFDIDLGAKWNPDQKLGVGITLQNIIPSNIGGKISWPNGDEQSMASVAKLGLSVLTDDKKLTLAFDSDIQLERPLPSTQHLGVEWAIHPNLSLRAGIDQSLNAATGGVGSNLTLGVGLNISSLKMDYSYHPYFDESGNTTHYISVTFMLPELSKKEHKAAVPTNIVTAELAYVATAELAPVTKTATSEKLAVIPVKIKPAPKIALETFYTVRAGDTLNKIALKFYGSTKSVSRIALYNHLSDPDKIRTGRKISIPALNSKAISKTIIATEVSTQQAVPAEKPVAVPVAAKPVLKRGYVSYTVRPGDVLNGIARKFYGSTKPVPYLAAYNHISDPDTLNIGQKMIIPALGAKAISKSVNINKNKIKKHAAKKHKTAKTHKPKKRIIIKKHKKTVKHKPAKKKNVTKHTRKTNKNTGREY